MQFFTRQFFILFFSGLIYCNSALFSQSMSINATGNPPAASAGLDIDFTGKGLLIPRMATGSRPASPATGLLIYNTTTNVFEYWNGSSWTQVGAPGWGLAGNTLTGTLPASPNEWIGSSNASDWIVKTNGTERIRVQSTGNVGIASATPGAKLDVIGPATGSGITIKAGGGGDLVLASGGSLFFDNNYSYAAGNYIRPYSANTQGFFTSGAERMTISSGGNVGIGSASPAYRLDLGGGTFGYGSSNQRTETRANAGLQGSAGAQSGFFETSAPSPAANWPTGASSWWHLLDVRHSNTANNYAMQFAGSFFDQNVYVRKTNNNAAQAWEKVLTTGTSVDLISIYFLYSTGDLCISGAWATYPSMSTTLALNAGDKVMVWASGGAMIDADCNGTSDANYGTFNVRTSVNGSDFPNGAWGRYSVDAWYGFVPFTAWSISGLYDVSADGNYTFACQGMLQSGSAVMSGGDNTSSLQATCIIFVYRP